MVKQNWTTHASTKLTQINSPLDGLHNGGAVWASLAVDQLVDGSDSWADRGTEDARTEDFKNKKWIYAQVQFLSVEVPYNIMWYCNTLIPTYNTSYFVGKVVYMLIQK